MGTRLKTKSLHSSEGILADVSGLPASSSRSFLYLSEFEECLVLCFVFKLHESLRSVHEGRLLP
jgi:uncharacterized protein (DUF2336 family)